MYYSVVYYLAVDLYYYTKTRILEYSTSPLYLIFSFLIIYPRNYLLPLLLSKNTDLVLLINMSFMFHFCFCSEI